MKNKLASILHFLDRDFTLSKRQVLFAFLALLIIGLGLRCGYWAMRDRPPRDEKFYIQAVVDIINKADSWDRDYCPNFGPLMPMIAASACQAGFTPEATLRTLNIIYSCLWLMIMFFLCREVFSSSASGLLGMALAAVNPYSVRMASQILREPLYMLIFTIGLWLAVRFIKYQSWNPCYPLLLAALAILGFFTRYEGIEIGLFLPLAVIVIFMQHKWRQSRKCVYSLAVYLLAIGLSIGVLIKSENIYICNTSRKAAGYLELFTGERWK